MAKRRRNFRRVKKTRLSGKACLRFWYPKENDRKIKVLFSELDLRKQAGSAVLPYGKPHPQ